ncbi:BfmA/BtgA family mobilization protein [Gaetbulibacter sp. M240]|uniref:BfmA/BtgA family mobilization protein n=1 Tax=Gaetbulibacter sp. M240 TaxID=3126511 RepID=UPI00374EA690
MKYKTIRIYESDFDKMNSFCDRYKLSKTELIEALLIYFEKTDLDPREPSNATKEISKLKSQLISFIKTQEKDKLNPLIKKQDLLITEFSGLVKDQFVTKSFMIELATKLGNSIVNKLQENGN